MDGEKIAKIHGGQMAQIYSIMLPALITGSTVALPVVRAADARKVETASEQARASNNRSIP
jgi:hypothetical protein